MDTTLSFPTWFRPNKIKKNTPMKKKGCIPFLQKRKGQRDLLLLYVKDYYEARVPEHVYVWEGMVEGMIVHEVEDIINERYPRDSLPKNRGKQQSCLWRQRNGFKNVKSPHQKIFQTAGKISVSQATIHTFLCLVGY